MMRCEESGIIKHTTQTIEVWHTYDEAYYTTPEQAIEAWHTYDVTYDMIWYDMVWWEESGIAIPEADYIELLRLRSRILQLFTYTISTYIISTYINYKHLKN